MKTNPNDKIHPIYTADGDLTTTPMTKREYFAAMAMQKMTGFDLGQKSESYPFANEIAKRAIIQADALINELNKNQ